MKNRRTLVPINGTVLDEQQGLQWMQSTFGQTPDGNTVQGKAVLATLQNALIVAQAFNFAGHKDWRLPTLQELSTLLDPLRVGLTAIDPLLFPNTMPARYWTTTCSEVSPAEVFYVDFNFGGVSLMPIDDTAYVRFVRSVAGSS